ncbi:MAG: hypothetical protein ACXWQQ_00750 [Pseudobdellovibrio sp.]
MCDFANDGKMLIGSWKDSKVILKDKNDQVIWTVEDAVSHDLRFSPDQNEILYIATEKAVQDGQDLRSDCFVKRDVSGREKARWCLSENLEKLKILGFKFPPHKLESSRNLMNRPDWAGVSAEISHANSIQEIPDNTLAKNNSAFSKGNYLVNLYTPSMALLVLDREMKQILWSLDFSKVDYNGKKANLWTHDNQILPDGRLLNYVNSFADSYDDEIMKNDRYSSIAQWNLNDDTGASFYTASRPKDFRVAVLGSVAPLLNGGVIFTDITYNNSVVATDDKGLEIWRLQVESPYTKKTKFKIHKVRPVYELGFLKARGLIPADEE